MRTLTEIEASLVESQPGLSTSAAAEWRGWVAIYAYAIWLFEVVMDLFRADIEAQLSRKQPGTLEWYSEQALAFQNGHALTVDEWGVVGYAIEDSTAQIVKRASVSEANGTVTVKVATINAETNELEPLGLTTGEFLNFQNYMDKIKFAGTWVEYRTLPADVVEYDVNVYFDPLYLPANVKAAVETALAAFRINIDFDARLYKTGFLNVIQAVPGVKTAKINSLLVTPSVGEPVELDVVLELASGYFNYSEGSVITMINA